MRRLLLLTWIVGLSLALIQAGCAAGGGYGGYSPNGGGTSSGPQTMSCPACGGGGACNSCYGDGRNPLDNHHRLPCTNCGGSGVCPRCHGRGTITY
jgi:hypothetical protein